MDDTTIEYAYALNRIADAIFPSNECSGTDGSGGHVESLTEAVMGITASGMAIAEAINNLADAVREANDG